MDAELRLCCVEVGCVCDHRLHVTWVVKYIDEAIALPVVFISKFQSMRYDITGFRQFMDRR